MNGNDERTNDEVIEAVVTHTPLALYTSAKYVLEPSGVGIMVESPGFQPVWVRMVHVIACCATHRHTCGADLIRVLLHVLNGLQRAQHLINIAAKCQVVDGGVLDDALQNENHDSASH